MFVFDMRIFFVLSATLWCWVVGRCISFGPNSKGLCWHPHMHADTWYRLTLIPLKIPHKFVTLLPVSIAIMSIPALYYKDDLIHAITVCITTSEHAFVPIFVAHIHAEKKLVLWAAVNAISIVILIKLIEHDFVAYCTTPKLLMWLYILYVEVYLLINGGPVTATPDEGRASRTIAV